MNRFIRGLIDEGKVTDPLSPKGKLLKHAALLFSEKGFESTTVRDLGHAVGIKSGSLFHHFDTKEEILKTVMVDTITIASTLQDDALSLQKDARSKLEVLIRTELDAIHGPTGTAMSLLISEWRSLSRKNQQEILDLRREYDQKWIDVLEELKDQGKLAAGDDPQVVRRLITGMLGWTSYWYKEDGPKTRQSLIEDCLNMVAR